MADVPMEHLQRVIADILKDADLRTITAKIVRQRLEDQLKVDLSDRKREVDDLVMMYLEENQDGQGAEEHKLKRAKASEDSEDSEGDGYKKMKKSKESEDSDDDWNKGPHHLSGLGAGGVSGIPKKPVTAPQMAMGMGMSMGMGMGVPDTTAYWQGYSQTVQPYFQAPYISQPQPQMPQMQPQMQQMPPQQIPQMPLPQQQMTSQPPKKSGPPSGKRETGYTRTCKLSPELADVVGTEYMARHEVVKKVWSIIKEKNLYDPKNKQFAICDDQLMKVVGTRRFRAFGMMKYLKNHFVD